MKDQADFVAALAQMQNRVGLQAHFSYLRSILEEHEKLMAMSVANLKNSSIRGTPVLLAVTSSRFIRIAAGHKDGVVTVQSVPFPGMNDVRWLPNRASGTLSFKTGTRLVEYYKLNMKDGKRLSNVLFRYLQGSAR